jgi:hypothetical protein
MNHKGDAEALQAAIAFIFSQSELILTRQEGTRQVAAGQGKLNRAALCEIKGSKSLNHTKRHEENQT